METKLNNFFERWITNCTTWNKKCLHILKTFERQILQVSRFE